MKPRSPEVSHDILSEVEEQFKSWRQSRPRGSRIPEALWAAAVEATREHSVSKVAGALRLDTYKLRQRVEASPGLAPVRERAFLEIPLPSSPVPECVFELEESEGIRLRVSFQGASPAELEPLARAFWSLAR